MKTVIALATAGMIASSVAAAAPAAQPFHRHAPMTLVQHDDRWDDRSGGVNEREARINARIQRGVHDGRITQREARRLYRELASIESKERAFGSDGRISRGELAALNRDLDRLAEHVRSQMRDDQRRY